MASNQTNWNENGDQGSMLKSEAEGAIEEIRFAVLFAALSQKHPCSEDAVYLNITTLENNSYCVELSYKGFKIVSRKFDTNDAAEISQYFETINAFLDTVSPQYRLKFSQALTDKLQQLQNSATE